jgi:hypothetical protein
MNTLAYYGTEMTMAVKSFTMLTQGLGYLMQGWNLQVEAFIGTQ